MPQTGLNEVLSLLDAPPSSLFPEDGEMREDGQEEIEGETLTYSQFLDQLREPCSAPLVQKISRFMSEMQSAPVLDSDDASSRVLGMLEEIEDDLTRDTNWSRRGELFLESAGEHLEKYVTSKLYSRLFGLDPNDAVRDAEVDRMLRTLSFLEPDHLEIPAECFSSLTAELAQNELRKMSTVKSPYDKLACILGCTKTVSKMLNLTRKGKGSRPGADEIFPVLVLVLVRSNPPNLHSNFQFVSRYRPSYRMNTELAYCYTHLVAALYFLDNLEPESLSHMTPEEFHRKMQAGAADTDACTTAAKPSAAPSVEGAASSLPKRVKPDDALDDDLFSDDLLAPTQSPHDVTGLDAAVRALITAPDGASALDGDIFGEEVAVERASRTHSLFTDELPDTQPQAPVSAPAPSAAGDGGHSAPSLAVRGKLPSLGPGFDKTASPRAPEEGSQGVGVDRDRDRGLTGLLSTRGLEDDDDTDALRPLGSYLHSSQREEVDDQEEDDGGGLFGREDGASVTNCFAQVDTVTVPTHEVQPVLL